MLSIIVPVYNEEALLPSFLRMVDLWQYPHELIFADGGSTDKSRALLRGRTVTTSEKGRGVQLASGLAASTGDHLLFLHVDTSIEETALAAIDKALDEGARWGCLTVDFTSHDPEYRFGIRKSNARVRLIGIPFGDQGMFMDRAALDAVGGIPPICIMEDYELSRRLRRQFGYPKQLPERILASVRRFRTGNSTLIGFKMSWFRMLYRLGVSPERIQERYGDVRTASEVSPRDRPLSPETLVLFTRVPVPGKAKTRLAPTLTPEQCAEVQRALIADTVEGLSSLNADVVVCYAPDHEDMPDSAQIFQDFVGLVCSCYHHPTRSVRFVRQEGENLGERMDKAFAYVFAQGAEKCLLMGSDIPDVSAEELERMFHSLDRRDVVLAPSNDGGYWLVGLKERFPELFSNKRYGTSKVFDEACRSCESIGLQVSIGPEKFDIDTTRELERYWHCVRHTASAPEHIRAVFCELAGVLAYSTETITSIHAPTDTCGKEQQWHRSLSVSNQAP